MATATKPRPKRNTAAAAEVKPRPAATKAKSAPASKPANKPAARSTKPAAKAATTKGSTTARSRTTKTADTAAKTPARTRTAKPAAAAQDGAQKASNGRVLDLHGFAPGSDSSLIAKALLDGGADRGEVNANATLLVKKTNGLGTRAGGEKSVPSLASGILKRLRDKGYTVESTWRLVPPADIAEQMKKEEQAQKRRDAAAARKAANGK